MESFRTEDGTVAKFIHTDGSETAIKRVPSQSTFVENGKVIVKYTDRGKYSIFISSSCGCYMKCPFCHLTSKGCQYRRLSSQQIVDNVIEAVSEEMMARPELKEHYVKLCWMGMGDAINQPNVVVEATIRLLTWIFANGYAKGLDSVDLSTVMPDVSDGWISKFAHLNSVLNRFPLNPNNANIEQAAWSGFQTYEDRSTFRLFYSLHSAIQDTRDRMVPNAKPLVEAIERLHALERRGVNVILHQIFVEGMNDSIEELVELRRLLADKFENNELRVLRYNSCDRSPYHEGSTVIQHLGEIFESHKRLKVQISAGSEVQAACGQFLVAKVKNEAR